jgi:hypothetical protein
MDMEKEKDARPRTPKNSKEKVDVVGSASTWDSRQLEKFMIEFDQKEYLDLKDIIDPKWFDFSANTELKKRAFPVLLMVNGRRQKEHR